jgi:hypothetical protein
VAAKEVVAHQYSALKTALVLIVSGSPIKLPMIGVMKLNLKLADTVMGYWDVGVGPMTLLTRPI